MDLIPVLDPHLLALPDHGHPNGLDIGLEHRRGHQTVLHDDSGHISLAGPSLNLSVGRVDPSIAASAYGLSALAAASISSVGVVATRLSPSVREITGNSNSRLKVLREALRGRSPVTNCKFIGAFVDTRLD